MSDLAWLILGLVCMTATATAFTVLLFAGIGIYFNQKREEDE